MQVDHTHWLKWDKPLSCKETAHLVLLSRPHCVVGQHAFFSGYLLNILYTAYLLMFIHQPSTRYYHFKYCNLNPKIIYKTVCIFVCYFQTKYKLISLVLFWTTKPLFLNPVVKLFDIICKLYSALLTLNETVKWNVWLIICVRSKQRHSNYVLHVLLSKLRVLFVKTRISTGYCYVNLITTIKM